jgi:hypothetical protein
LNKPQKGLRTQQSQNRNMYRQRLRYRIRVTK